jgi:signal peptidase I
MERILDGASGDAEQHRDSAESPENNQSYTTESAARRSLDVSLTPEPVSFWKPATVSPTKALQTEVEPEIGIRPMTPGDDVKQEAQPNQPIPLSTVELENKPVMLREIEANTAGPEINPHRPVSTAEPAHSRAGAMLEDEYWATEYGLHFPITAAGSGGNDGGGTQPPKEAANAEPADTKAGPPTSAWTEVKSLARDVAFAAITAILIVVFVVQPVKVEGTSMLPQLENGERIFVNKFIYSFDSIHRGDIVVFWYPDNPSQSFIKRVIGLPGDTIKVVNGRVYINDKLYNEPYLARDRTQQLYNFGPEKVKQYHYFVMGDNRDASNDSRAWGEVPEKYIYGKAMFRYWPLSSFGSIQAQADDNQ